MDTSPWPQEEIVLKPMDEIVITNTTTFQKPPLPPSSSSNLEGKVRLQKDHHQQQAVHALKCPRCDSNNTKFCYYNNYSLSQPRYFCKNCRRYWTEGGSLRNIPVGGGSRKNKRSHSSSLSSSPYSSANSTSSSKKPHENPNVKIHENTSQDLNLGFLGSNPGGEMNRGPRSFGNNEDAILQDSSSAISLSNISAMELLNGFNGSSRGLDNSGFVSMATSSAISTDTDHHHQHLNTVYSNGFPFSSADEFIKPNSLSFLLEGSLGNNYGSFEKSKEDLNKHKVVSNDADQKEYRAQHGGEDSSAGFWNGVIGGGSW